MKLFDSIRIKAPRKNKFDLSHEKKLTCGMGMLVPIMVQDVVPGDSFRAHSEVLLRFAPMLAPIMHRINVFCHYFYVPNRIIWDEWQDFITGGKDGDLNPIQPYFEMSDANRDAGIFSPGSLADYLGVPVAPGGVSLVNTGVSALPFRAYQLIYDEFFRDQNLSDPVGCSKSSGRQDGIAGEVAKLGTLRKRAWEKDYFTSCLPWSQRGGEVGLPMDVNYKMPARVIDGAGQPATAGNILGVDNINAGELESRAAAGGNEQVVTIDNIDSFSTTINDLRKAVRLQEWLEKNARGGARYVEQILSHFGVMVPDSRLQRPEFLGGGVQPVSVSEVLSNFQFSGDPDGLPQGNMSGHGISVGRSNGFKHKFVEHGYVIGVMSVLPKTAYQQGLPRHFTRGSRYDYFWPEFANIGEQEVKNQELYWEPTSAPANEGVFGYQSRYAEYKYQPSTVHGQFKTSLTYWHMGREFTTTPALNEDFVMADPTKRIFAVEDQPDPLYVQIYNKVDALRPMPYFGTPRL